MQTLVLTKAITAKSAVAQRRLVTLGSDGNVTQASQKTQVIIGVSSDVDTTVGQSCDVHLLGIADVEVAGACVAGNTLSCDANGRATPTTTADSWVVGVALQSASAEGDIISVLLQPLKL